MGSAFWRCEGRSEALGPPRCRGKAYRGGCGFGVRDTLACLPLNFRLFARILVDWGGGAGHRRSNLALWWPLLAFRVQFGEFLEPSSCVV